MPALESVLANRCDMVIEAPLTTSRHNAGNDDCHLILRGGGGKPHHGWRQKGTWSIAAFVGDGEGHELVDEAIRLEDAAARLPILGNELHLPGPDALRLPHVNVHRHAKYTAYYDDETAEHVARLYAEDIARFDYRFGS